MTAARIRPCPAGPEGSVLLEAAARLILHGGIVAHPTDTLYGLAVDPWREVALERLIELKGRGASKGMILIAANRDQAFALLAGPAPPAGRRLAEAFWPGPLTLVLPAGMRAPEGVLGPSGGVAVRVPADPVAIGLVEAAGRPLTSTSANRAGEPPARTAEAVAEAFGMQLDLILDGGPRGDGPASTVVDLLHGGVRILREGSIGRGAVEAALQDG